MDTARRDQWGRYLVVPPGGGKPVGYTRATTVAKVLDDGGGLMPWKAAMAMTGMMRRSGLRGRFEALLSAHPETGPWYGGDEAKAAVKKLVEECAEAGGSTDRADIGTALHAIVEQLNRGEAATISQDSTRADVAAYQAALAERGITFDVDHIEATVVLDSYKVAGTADGGVVRIPGLGAVVADLKTGTNLDYSWQAIAVQLAVYANGDNHYHQGANADGSLDERLPAPDVRKDVAVVIHLPAGEGRCDLYTVNIEAGWEAFRQSMWTREWRARKDLAAPLPIVDVPTATEAPAGEPVSVLDTSRGVLLELVLALPADRQQVLRDSWPKTWPKLKKADGWTPELLHEATTMIARAASAPIASATPARPTPTSNGSTAPPVDGDTAGVVELERLRDTLRALPEDVVKSISEAAFARGVPSLREPDCWTVEHVAIVDALLEPRDWSALVTDAGITKAACQRRAKEIAAELGIEKLPATIERMPNTGEFAVRLFEWITVQAKASAA